MQSKSLKVSRASSSTWCLRPTKSRIRCLSLICFIAFALLIASTVAVAAPAYVILAAAKGAPGLSSLPQQLANWQQSGLVTEAQLLRSDANAESNFELLGILELPDEQALQRWQETGVAELGEGVNAIVTDVLAHLEKNPQNSANSVFSVMQYDVMVPQAEFQDYIDGYQVPEMVVRIEAGGLLRYTSYYKRSESTAPWQSLLVVEYRDADAFKVSAEVNSEMGKELAKTDKTFAMYKETKHDIRDKTLTTEASWVELPPADIEE